MERTSRPLILVLTLSLSIFTFLALFMSHQSASTIREISQMYMSSMGDQIAMHFETTIGLRLDQLVSMVQTVLPADAHASPSQEQDLITNAQARDFTHLAFYRTDGSFDMMYGAEVELTVHRVVLAEDPLEVALPEGVPGADDEAAVLADDEGVDVVAVLLQGQGVADVGGGGFHLSGLLPHRRQL